MYWFCQAIPKPNLRRHRLAAGWQVSGFSGALHRRYPSLKAAQFAWDCACRDGCVGPPKEWGAARAREVTPSQSSLIAARNEDHTSAQRAIPWNQHAQNRRRPIRIMSSTPFAIPRTDNNLPMLYALRFAPAPAPSNETWYVVLMGAHPGVYLGR